MSRSLGPNDEPSLISSHFYIRLPRASAQASRLSYPARFERLAVNELILSRFRARFPIRSLVSFAFSLDRFGRPIELLGSTPLGRLWSVRLLAAMELQSQQ